MPNGYVSFPANPKFYANCTNDGGVQNMTMYKCDDGYIFDISSKKCIFECISAGYFTDPLNCTGYYFCEGWIKFKSTRFTCPTGQYFDGMRCVDGMDCGAPTTTPPYEGPPVSTPPDEGPPVVTPPYEGPPVEDPDAPPVVDSEALTIGFDSPNDQGHVVKTTTTRPSTFPFSIWKHKGKYSIRLAKFL